MEIEYGDVNLINIEPERVDTAEFRNGTTAQAEQIFVVSKTTSDSFTWT